MVVSHTRVIQVTNIAPQATKDQMQTLFGYLGKIDDIRLYPTIRDVSCPVQSRICYVKYYEASTVAVAQHMTNTVFIDRALIVIPVQSGEIPDEHKALEMSSNGTLVPGLNPADPRLPPDVVNTLEGVPPNQVIQTHDPRLPANGLPNYPPLPAAYDTRKVEEIRRTILVIDVPANVTSQQLIEHFGTAGQVKYVRFCERDSDKLRYALVELSDQDSVQKALNLNGSQMEGSSIKVHHATQAISKPQTKSNEAAQREIEEAMCRVKEAQNLISAAIDPVIGMLSKDKRRSRSRSRSRRRSRSRQRSRRSRSRSRHRSRRSRSRSRRVRHRSRSRSSRRRRSRSRSHGKSAKSSRRERSRNRDRDRDKPKKEDKEKPTSPDKESSVEKKRSTSVETTKDKRRSRSRERKSNERRTSKSRDKEKKRSRSRDRRDKSRSRGKRRSKSRDRKRSRSRDKKRSRSRDRKRSKSRERSKRSKSRDRKRSRSRDRKRSASRGKSKRASKSPSVESKRAKESKEKEAPKVARDYDEEERGFEADTVKSVGRRSSSPDAKDSPDNMDISNSP